MSLHSRCSWSSEPAAPTTNSAGSSPLDRRRARSGARGSVACGRSPSWSPVTERPAATDPSPAVVAPGARTVGELDVLVADCRACPRLVAWRELVARERKPAYRSETYWGRAVPGFRPAEARILIVGLAPAAHGANRTGRMFTGDRSGAWLSRAMYRSGFATAPYSRARDDGFEPIDAFITAALRCAPPANKPTPVQMATCSVHMRAELALLHRLRVAVGLGKIGFDAAYDRLEELGYTH